MIPQYADDTNVWLTVISFEEMNRKASQNAKDFFIIATTMISKKHKENYAYDKYKVVVI